MRFQHAAARHSMACGIGKGDSFRRDSFAGSLCRRRFFDSLHGNRFANLLMRLKIEIAGGLLRKMGKDRPRDKPAVIQLRFARVRIIEPHETDKLGMLSRKIASEINDVLSLFISASRINFLRGSGFSSNGKAWHGRGGGGPAVAHDAS